MQPTVEALCDGDQMVFLIYVDTPDRRPCGEVEIVKALIGVHRVARVQRGVANARNVNRVLAGQGTSSRPSEFRERESAFKYSSERIVNVRVLPVYVRLTEAPAKGAWRCCASNWRTNPRGNPCNQEPTKELFAADHHRQLLTPVSVVHRKVTWSSATLTIL